MQKLLENLRDVEIAPLKARWDAERAKADEHKDAQEKLERLKAKAAAARRQGDYERRADVEYGAIPELEKKLQQLAENAMDVDDDAAVKAAGTQQGRIEHVGTVGCGD